MYGKGFTSMYEGSMVGKGAVVFAVWGYCTNKADPEAHTVSLNPELLAKIIGEPEEKIVKAIEFLCSPDGKSRCEEYDGRRLLPQAGYDYYVVTHAYYRGIKNMDDIRSYYAEMKRKSREKGAGKPDKPEKKDKFLPYKPYAEKLKEIIQGYKNIKISDGQVTAWSKAFYTLAEKSKVSEDRIKNALAFLAEHIGEKYIPVIESGETFQKKFLRLEEAMKRAQENRVFKSTLTEKQNG